MFRCITAQDDKNKDERQDTRMLIVPLPSGSFIHPTFVALCCSGPTSMDMRIVLDAEETKVNLCIDSRS